jgi:Cof subfamily protein (haloacid dehalogenase superfamily)
VSTNQRPRLIASDVDGTLAGDDHEVSARTMRALSRLAEVGADGVIITGRTEESALRTAREAGLVAPVVACNGAVVTDTVTGERLWLRHMEPEAAQRVVAAVRDAGAQATVWTPDRLYADEPGFGSDLQGLLNQADIHYRPLEEVTAAEPVVKIMAGGEPALMDAVAAQLAERAQMLRSMPELMEVSPPGAAKENALAFLLAHLGIDGQDCWGFGDGENDVAWLSLMGRALVPANGFPGPKAIATEIILANGEDGVAEYLERVLLG